MKATLVIILTFIPTVVISQVFDMENIDLGRYSINSVSITDKFKDIENAGKVLSFNGDGSYIEFKAISDCKTIQLNYVSSISGDLLLVVSYKKSSETTYSTLIGGSISNLNKNTLVLNRFLPVYIPVSFMGEYDFKLSIFLPQQGNGIFVIDNLEFVKFSPKEVEDYKTSQVLDGRILSATDKIYSENRRIDYNIKVSNLKDQYINKIEVIRELSYRSNVLASLSNSIVMINERAKLNDPNQYSIFSEKVKFIKDNADEIQKVYLDTLINQIKYKPIPPINASADKKQGILKLLQVAGDIGNIISGGQFKNIVNSIQGIVSTVFTKSSIQNKVIEYVQSGSNPKPKFIGKQNMDDISKLILKGKETQAFLFDFFVKLEEEQKQFRGIIEDFKNYSFEADQLIDGITQNQNDFYKTISFSFTDKTFDQYYMRIDDQGKKLLDSIKNVATNSFKALEIQRIRNAIEYNSKESELTNVQNVLANMDELGRKYDAMASKLKTLFGKIDADLKKPNPFGKLENGIWIKNDFYKNSFDEYENTRRIAQNSYDELKKSLDIVLKAKSIDD